MGAQGHQGQECRAELCPPVYCLDARSTSFPTVPLGRSQMSAEVTLRPQGVHMPPAENHCPKTVPTSQSSGEPSGDWLALKCEQAMKGHKPASEKTLNFKVREQNK